MEESAPTVWVGRRGNAAARWTVPDKPFSEVRELLESHGWVLQRTWRPYFVFMHPDQRLPLLIPVHNRMVTDVYVEKIRSLLGEE